MKQAKKSKEAPTQRAQPQQKNQASSNMEDTGSNIDNYGPSGYHHGPPPQPQAGRQMAFPQVSYVR